MTDQDFIVVEKKEFDEFIDTYPRRLSSDVCGISEPPLVGFYDFEKGVGFQALVAKYHQYPDRSKRVYRISRHFL